jgi:hypothetical protein
MTRSGKDDAELLRRIKDDLPAFRALLVRSSDEWGYEDPIYRFYHHSFKVFGLQNQTVEIVAALQNLLPHRELNPWFLEIVAQGTGREFSIEQNAEWPRNTRPILEAYFHARYFLEMVVRYQSLAAAPTTLPSGWAALLCLYGLR